MTHSEPDLTVLLPYIPRGPRREFAKRHLAGECVGEEVQETYFQLNVRRDSARFPRRQFFDYAFALCALYPSDRNMAFNAASSLYEMKRFEAAAGWHLFASKIMDLDREGEACVPRDEEVEADDSKYFVVLSLAEQSLWLAALLHLQNIQSVDRQREVLDKLLQDWEP